MQAIERIRAALDAGIECYGDLSHVWVTDEDDDGNLGLNIVGANLDGELYPVLEIDTAQYYQEEDGPKLAEYYAACNPTAMSEILAHIAALEAENERLRKDAERKPMTDEQIYAVIPDDNRKLDLGEWVVFIVRAIEAFHGIKGTP